MHGTSVTVLSSGSCGNSIVFSSDEVSVMVDAGLSCKELERRMSLFGLDPEGLDALLLTHEHSDHVRGLEVEDTTLISTGGDTQAKRLSTKRVIDVDTVIFCIGDRVDENFGLPVRKNEFVKNPNPRFPVDGISFEAYDPNLDRPIERVFVAGWSREASSGLVGIARKTRLGSS